MKNTALGLFALFLTLLAPAIWAESVAAPETSEIMELLSTRLSAIRRNLDQMETLPAASSIWRDRRSAQADLDKILDEIIALLVGSDYQADRRALFDIEDRIAALEISIDELRIERLTAPPSPDELSLYDRALRRTFAPHSREAIDEEIALNVSEITSLTREREAIIREFRQRLEQYYEIEISTDQARSLLYQINGSSIVEASKAFAILQQIEARLREIRMATNSDAVLRRYYGMAAALRLVTARLYARHLGQYEEDWLPAIDRLDLEQHQLIAETETALASESNEQRRGAYENNLGIQMNVSLVIDEYRELLQERMELTQVRLDEARQDAQLAINTLRTLENAAMLFDQFLWNNDEFNALITIRNSDLIPLDDSEVTGNYLDLSRQLVGS